MDNDVIPPNQPRQPYNGPGNPPQNPMYGQPTGPGPSPYTQTPVAPPTYDQPARPAYSFNAPPSSSMPSAIENPQTRESIKSVLGTALILILAPIFALVITSFLFQSYEVDGPSMQETLQDGDRLVVLKAGKTWSKIFGKDYVPDRYAIVVFERPDSAEDKQLIKRVIGLPGERIVVEDGNVTLYNKEHPQGYNPDKDTVYEDTIKSTPGKVDITVEEGEIFVMGDNRGNSADSRLFGTVKSGHIAGKLVLRVFPFNKAQVFN